MFTRLLLTTIFFATISSLFSQGNNNLSPIVIPQKQALLVDYISEGAGASHIFGFFFLDIDTDKDGTPDFFETAPGDDLDGDGLNNSADPDDDNDGIPDASDVQPIGITSMPTHLFRNGTIAEANGSSSTDYWQFVPNNLISGGPFDGYFEHPGAYLYVDNNANAVPDILEYITGDNQMPPFVVDKGVATEHALLGAYLGLLGSWEYSGSPGATIAERSHLTGSTIFYICDDDGGNSQSSFYHTHSPYGTTYSDIYGNTNGQVDYNIYGTAVSNSTLIPQEILGMDPQGQDFFRYRWFEHIVDANREVVYFASVFWGSGGSQLNTYYSKAAFNPEIISNSFSPVPNSNTTGDNFGGSGINNWYPRFQHTGDHNMLAEAVFGAGTTWAMIASSPTDGSSPIAVDPADQAWVDQYENWTTGTRIVQYIDVTEWLNDAPNDAYALINGRYGVDLSSETQDIIIRMDQERLPHFMVFAPTDDPNSLVIGLEDLYGGGDRDFEDVVFYVTDFKETNVTAYKNDQFTPGQCQDTIQYKIVIRNSGDPTANGIVFTDSPDPNSMLAVGSVTTTVGTVVLGNTAGNTTVQVDVGSLAEGDSAVICFTVNVNDGIYPGVTTISNQGTVNGTNFSSINTTDPEQDLHFQPTITDLTDILDLTPPSISCPSNIVTNTDPGSCNAVVNHQTPQGTDNCPGTSTSLITGLASGSAFPVGPTIVTYRVTDAAGNSSDCSFTVTVNDNESPTANCVVPYSLPLNAAGSASITADDINNGSSDACGIASTSVQPSSFGCGEVGPNTVTLTVEDNNNNSSTCTTVVTIEDNTLPTALCQNITIQLDANSNGTASPSAVNNGSSDACGLDELSLDNSSFTCSELGPNPVVLTVYDNNGNSSTCSATVTVEDMVMPTANCNNITIDLIDRNTYNLTQANIDAIATNASDNCPGFSYAITEGQTSYDCDDRDNSFIVTLTVTDGSSNTSSCMATVSIADPNSVCNDPPVAVCQDITVFADANCEASINAEDVDGGSSDPDLDPLTFSVDNNGPFTLGMQTVTLTVSDGEFTSSCTAVVTVEDNTPPIAVCLDATIDFNGEDEIQLTSSQVWDQVNSSDNCGAISLENFSPMSVTCDQIGSNVAITLTVSDGQSNTSDCTANVSIEGLPCGWHVDPDGINCPDAEAAFDTGNSSFTLSTEGCYDPNYYRPADSQGFIQQELCGDGEIIAQITQVTGNGWAGITMRESNDPSAKMLQLMIDGVSLTRRELRQSTGGVAFAHQFQTLGKNWLRLTRSGNVFGAYHSSDGINWQPVLVTNIAMANCIEIGLLTMNGGPSGEVSATFDNVSINSTTGSNLQASTPPTMEQWPNETIEQWSDKSIKLFPNPTSEIVNLKFGGFDGKPVQARIYNHLGQMVKQFQWEEADFSIQQINISDLQAGTYIVEVRSGEERVSKKLVVARM